MSLEEADVPRVIPAEQKSASGAPRVIKSSPLALLVAAVWQAATCLRRWLRTSWERVRWWQW